VDSDRRACLTLFFLALVVRLLVAWSLPGPPYVDAYFYTVGAWRLAEGYGFTEPFLWHYLDLPTSIPRPGFLYWMPLPSVLAAPLLALFSPVVGRSFLVAQVPFILLSSLLSPISYAIACQTTGLRRHAWAAGLLTLFSGFFFPFWTLLETFAPFALFGCLALSVAGRQGRWLDALWVGVLVGLAHLTRADGVLLLPVVALAPLISSSTRNAQSTSGAAQSRPRYVICFLSLVLVGYLLAMAPWFVRNLRTIGQPLSPAGTKTLWLRTYDDIACYGCDLSLHSYLAWGWGNILSSKLSALWINFQRFLAENCQILLLPFVLVGLYRLKRRLSFALSILYLFLLYSTHSLIFTFPGWRGGFFHSSGALLPFLYMAAMEGLDAAVGWVARRRQRWNLPQARVVFTTAAVVAALALSLYALTQTLPTWRRADAAYREIGAWLKASDVQSSAVVLVNNPPGFTYHTGIPSVVVPNGDVETLAAVADRYQVAYVVLDRNRSEGLAEVYAGAVTAGLEPVATFNDGEVKLYRWIGSP